MEVKIVSNNGIMIGSRVRVADNFFSRLKGLMFLPKLEKFDGLLITECKSIHTCFMQFPLDAIFLDAQCKVVKIIRNMKPWRMTGIYFKATQVLELNQGGCPENLSVGEKLEVVCIN